MDLSPTHAMPMQPTPMHEHRSRALARTLLIGLIAFLTVIDLFGTQAILPALTKAYGVTPAAMGFAVNATTVGMAVAGLGVAYFSRHIDRRRGILVALTLLALPTASTIAAQPRRRDERCGRPIASGSTLGSVKSAPDVGRSSGFLRCSTQIDKGERCPWPCAIIGVAWVRLDQTSPAPARFSAASARKVV